MILATFQNERVYEGNLNFLNAVYPMPSLSAVVIDHLAEPALGVLGNPHPATSLLFREDSFDPTTRVRRGRFYVADSPSIREWQSPRVNHYPYAQPIAGRPLSFPMNAYRSIHTSHPPRKPLIFLGSAVYATAWHILAAERLFNDETLFILKAANALGTLPDIAENSLPAAWRSQIMREGDKVADAALKYMPVPIVDVCREFARIILAAWLSTIGKAPTGDLGDLIKAIPNDRSGIASAAGVINRLHPRGKSSEQERQAQRGIDLREICDEDGELSISLVGFLLREFGWAPPTNR